MEQISRGVCQDISVVPEKKGHYKLSLEFEYDPASLGNLTTMINGVTSSTRTTTTSPAQQSVNSFDVNIPGMNITPNQDGTISFAIPDKDGGTSEISAMLAGMNIEKREDGTVSFSITPDATTSLPEHNSGNVVTSTDGSGSSGSPITGGSTHIKTTRTTTTTTSSGGSSTLATGQMSIPRSSNINIKLPCPQHHQSKLKTSVADPGGKAVPASCTIIDEDTVNMEFTPTGGNGTYVVTIFIGDVPFPGSPIQLEVKGL